MKGDHYAGQFPAEQFAKFGITFEASDRNKSQVYLDFLPLLNSIRVELLDDVRVTNQLCSLERRTGRTANNKELIDHPPGAHFHDDVINAVAMATVNASSPYGTYDPFFGEGREQYGSEEEARARRIGSFLSHVRQYG